ncbi:enoyl-[acyl-carrier-protein] reductase FabV [Kitasatospora brasiliensis]|uniref:enoyl-[acyl-carrier-protein] reductase FabV n=1 Tax=Kitasatospora brasiliensis TaxID=3058040 RepID=UPI00292F57F1|nr:enoyl-[acyl-carrier-protein] reductase FabV [Kitasatospora sp. K002]
MSIQQITPKQRGYLIVNSHPSGSEATVDRQWQRIEPSAPAAGRAPVALVLGASAGYGQALLLAERYGPVDYLVYSLASPRRTDPATGEVHHSVIKPLGSSYTSPSLLFEDEAPRIGTVDLTPADEAERAATVKVMGGEDWELWVRALGEADLLGPGFTTVALSYVGSEITAPVYRQGTIGAAKEHLEAPARRLQDGPLADRGRAFTVVAGAAVTQASTAIPSIALYTSLLRIVLGEDGWHTTDDQAVELWEQLTGAEPLSLDEQGRIRLDGWELDPGVQDRVRELWADPAAALAADPAAAAWFYNQFRQLYGWDVPGVDYTTGVETSVPWPE